MKNRLETAVLDKKNEDEASENAKGLVLKMYALIN